VRCLKAAGAAGPPPAHAEHAKSYDQNCGMSRFLLAFILALEASAKEPTYELYGRIEAEVSAPVSISGATTPFSDSTLADPQGRFHFRKLTAGTYTLSFLVPGRGEARVTVEIGPGTADSRRRVEVRFNPRDSDFTLGDVARQRHAVSARELAIGERAWREYDEARKDLARRDADSATAHLQKAVEMSPQFEVAWNTLGTIAYQTRKYERAEEYFRRALAQNPNAYEPLVNLGGVLINLHKLDEAREYNERAVSMRPNDALANSQLGMTWFELGKFDRAEKYLDRAIEIDPTHFSHPQLMLAEIHIRENQRRRAAEDLENFVLHHPDWPQAQQLRATIAKLKEDE